jgi:hypothetical protein
VIVLSVFLRVSERFLCVFVRLVVLNFEKNAKWERRKRVKTNVDRHVDGPEQETRKKVRKGIENCCGYLENTFENTL